MNCPTCRQPMIVLELEEIEVDYCGVCRGIWLDAGELELLLDNAAQTSNLFGALHSAQTNELKRKCPICRKKMDKVHAGHSVNAAVTIDHCPNDHGLWFDEGELQTVLQMVHLDDEGKVKHLLGELFCADKGS